MIDRGNSVGILRYCPICEVDMCLSNGVCTCDVPCEDCSCARMDDKQIIKKLAYVIMDIDMYLPRGADMPDDADKPKWCDLFCEHLESPAGECCGVCSMLSEITRQRLDKYFR